MASGWLVNLSTWLGPTPSPVGISDIGLVSQFIFLTPLPIRWGIPPWHLILICSWLFSKAYHHTYKNNQLLTPMQTPNAKRPVVSGRMLPAFRPYVLYLGLTQELCKLAGHAGAIKLVYHLAEKGVDLMEHDLFALHQAVQPEQIVDVYKPVGG